MPLFPRTLTTASDTSSTSTPTTVAAATSNTTILAANSSRKGASITNFSTATLYLEFGAAATATAFTVALFSNDYYEVPARYTGIISGIWSAANGSALVREFT